MEIGYHQCNRVMRPFPRVLISEEAYWCSWCNRDSLKCKCILLFYTFFLQEIFRQGHKSCLYYPLYPSYTSKEVRTLLEKLWDLLLSVFFCRCAGRLMLYVNFSHFQLQSLCWWVYIMCNHLTFSSSLFSRTIGLFT